ncbi:major facilitator superfamily domain-containing protein [Mycena rebaudengoi]|nr:major facilitator superfamily domain-containing protein [Mycena rebaudengoi]
MAAGVVHVLDQRRRVALAEVDNAPFSLFHVKVCLVAGVGFFTDAYDIFAIGIASVMLAYVYGDRQQLGAEPKLGRYQELGIKVATPVGTLFGQLLFGWLADVMGRKKMYGIELIIIISATFVQALSAGAHAVSIVGVLVIWRFIMGVGIGGDYPLSATISSEFASTRIRGRMMTTVFAAQGWGNLAACLTAFIITVAYKNAILNDPDVDHLNHIDFMWRLLIGLGCVPAVIALYFRLTIPETPRFTMDIERNVIQAADDIENIRANGRFNVDPDAVVQRADAPRASMRDFLTYFGKWENMKLLIGTSYSWFALDIAFYGLGFNSPIILQGIGLGSVSITNTSDIYTSLKNICVGNLILSLAGLIPGYWVAFLFIDSWGRKPIQLMGFTILAITFIGMGFGYDKLVATAAGRKTFVFLYCLINFFQNFGPNTTTFIIPGEIFPTRYRSTAHGIAAASGKLGAIVAQVAFFKLDPGSSNSSASVKHILEIFAFFMLTGIASTLLLPETKGKSLEELSNENQVGFLRGPAAMIEVQDGVVVHV